MNFNIGDIVLIPRGQKTLLFEVIYIEDDYVHVSNGHIQIRKSVEDLVLICKAEDRKDHKWPLTKYWDSKTKAIIE